MPRFSWPGLRRRAHHRYCTNPSLPHWSHPAQQQQPPPPETHLHSPPPPPPPPPLHDHLLLSLLRKHQASRGPSTQVHSHLITAARHRDRMSETGLMIWNTLIRHYSLGCSPQEAILLYKQMQDICTPRHPTDTFTFSFLLKASSPPGEGTQFHALIVKKGFELHIYIHTALVGMYAACGSLVDARRAFDEMPDRNSVAWNAMITGLIRWGELTHARLLFEQMPYRDVISWTGMIDGYTRDHRPAEALALFRRMTDAGVKPTEVTVLAIVPAISNLGALDMGGSLHAHCGKRGIDVLDVRVENSLMDMYTKCGSIESSLKIFDGMSGRRNLVSWTSMMSGFATHGMASEAVGLFEEMGRAGLRPNRVTFLSVLNACSHGGLVEEGLRFFASMVHEHAIDPEIKHYGCVIDMLGRAGRLGEAEEVIAGMPVAVSAVVWRTLLGCCCKHGDVEMGERVVRRILELERGDGGDFVILSNILAGAGRFGDAERVRGLMDERNVVKVPGHSLIGGKEQGF